MKKMYIFEWQTVHSLLFMPVEKVLSVAAKNVIDFLKRYYVQFWVLRCRLHKRLAKIMVQNLEI